MEAYRYETVVKPGGKVALEQLPIKAGSHVEIIILVQPQKEQRAKRYPLHDVPITYIDPTEPVAETDWDAAR